MSDEAKQKEEPKEYSAAEQKQIDQMKEDLRWLSLVCPEVPKLEDIEISAQTLGILQTVNPFLKNIERSDIMLLALVGYIASKARQADQERFNQVSPYTYCHLAYAWRGTDEDGKKYPDFIKRISGG